MNSLASAPSLPSPYRKTLLVNSKPADLADTVIVFVSSLFVTSAIVAPPAFAVYKLVKIIIEYRRKARLEELERLNEKEEDKQTESKPSPSTTPQQTPTPSSATSLRNKLIVYTASILAVLTAYSIYINTRASSTSRKSFKNNPIWCSFRRYFSFSILRDSNTPISPTFSSDQKVIALIPHGIMPYGLSMAALSPESEEKGFGPFRVVAATATKLVPPLAYIIRMFDGVDASKESVNFALKQGDSVALAPGGIAEMFVGYPKPGCLKDDEIALLSNRKGFIKLCIQHGITCVPCYVFGSSQLMRRIHVPGLETLSNFLRSSIVLMYGRFGLPVPFAERMLYVVGTSIDPIAGDELASMGMEAAVEAMHGRFCEEVMRIFESNKEEYGWGHKSLRIA